MCINLHTVGLREVTGVEVAAACSEHLGGLGAGCWASSKEGREVNLLPCADSMVYGPKLRRTLARQASWMFVFAIE